MTLDLLFASLLLGGDLDVFDAGDLADDLDLFLDDPLEGFLP